MRHTRDGLAFGAAAYLLWGLFPLYWPLLEPAGTIEILADRMVFAFIVMLAVIAATKRTRQVRDDLRNRRRLGFLVAAAVVITANWGTYIYGVNAHHVVETSLGYFINPLLTIALGVLVLGERLRTTQWIAVGIGALAVAVITLDYGRPPWIALVLATSFGLYGFCKKQAAAGAAESMLIETGVLVVPALIALAVVQVRDGLVFGDTLSTTLLLAGTGVVTAVPLLLFAAGTRRLPLSIVGLLQYLAPVLQFAIGVGVRHEHLPAAEWVGFVLVWAALIILTVDGLRASRPLRESAVVTDRTSTTRSG